MEKKKLINQLDIEKLYRHVLILEGPRHVLDNSTELIKTANYILAEFKKYGLKTEEQLVKIDGVELPYKNVEGFFGNGDGPEIRVTVHYDTVPLCPGAADNLTGIAIMLEIARIISKTTIQKNIRFIAFTSEEGNPYNQLKLRRLSKELGLTNKYNKYYSYQVKTLVDRYQEIARTVWRSGKSAHFAHQQATNQLEGNIPEKVLKLFKEFEKISASYTSFASAVGKTALIGSNAWVEKAIKNNKKIACVLNLDNIGWFSNKPHSQTLSPIDERFLQMNNVELSNLVGNFVLIGGIKNSSNLANTFLSQCKKKNIDMPCLSVIIPLDFDGVSTALPDLLRSDQAPFWREDIPGLFITDTGGLRSDLYHTPGDTIENVDFASALKVCKAVLGTVIEF